MKQTVAKANGISSEAVAKATGKTWDEWLALLDRAGADKMKHADIARYLHEKAKCPDWWCQMVTVGYEQERGLREKFQSCNGVYVANASKTIGVPLARLYSAWNDPQSRSRWFPKQDITIRKANKDKSMRITWEEDGSSLEVNFYAKGPEKSSVAMSHSKLADAAAVLKRKEYWGQALEKLKNLLEKSKT